MMFMHLNATVVFLLEYIKYTYSLVAIQSNIVFVHGLSSR